MSIQITITVRGSFREIAEENSQAIRDSARSAVVKQSGETKADARLVVRQGLRQRAGKQVANTIRSRVYLNEGTTGDPAALVYSSWGYFSGGQFYDILGTHTHGAVILPKMGRYLFIPFESRGRREFRRARQGDKLELVPTRGGGYLVLKLRAAPGSARGLRRKFEGTPIGELVHKVTLRKRLDFGRTARNAQTGLEIKFVRTLASKLN
jgi:uncharacterized protein DUF6441